VSVAHLRASDWQVQTIPSHAEAARMIRANHYAKGTPNTSTYRHGLYASGVLVGELLGVAMWLPPTRPAAESVDENWRGVLALTRLSVADEVPTNGASFLLGRSMKMIDRGRWPTLVTYADTALGHTGAIYRATNWECLGTVPAGDVWVTADGEQVGRKRGPRSLTRAEMEARGYTPKPSAPKVKFVHRSRGSKVAA
jgi:hypothetical protein